MNYPFPYPVNPVNPVSINFFLGQLFAYPLFTNFYPEF